jgi:hypothetical protein
MPVHDAKRAPVLQYEPKRRRVGGDKQVDPCCGVLFTKHPQRALTLFDLRERDASRNAVNSSRLASSDHAAPFRG